MAYDLAKINITVLMRPAFDAGSALTRLDERIVRSPVGQGFLERNQFTDACASLWIDGELVHLEDLVLHDATRDIRTPTHELTIARDVLRTRRRIAAQLPSWALSPDGIRTLRNTSEITSVDADEAGAAGVMLSSWYPITTIENLELNTFWDGVFHSGTYVFVLAGLFVLWRSGRLSHFRWSTGDLIATMLIGFGTFNLIEGVVDHHLLGLHHVNETVPRGQWLFWDLGFLAWGGAMIAVGALLMRRRHG